METLRIKNMVCGRCIKSVTKILCDLDIEHKSVSLGEAEIISSINKDKKIKLDETLRKDGFELIDDKRSVMIENIKQSLREVINKDISEKIVLSKLLVKKLSRDYSYLSSLFSQTEGETIEKYFIKLKIEKAKEMLVYGELTLSEIAWKLGYSSVQHLSNQFRQVTGLSPTHFLKVKALKRTGIDKI